MNKRYRIAIEDQDGNSPLYNFENTPQGALKTYGFYASFMREHPLQGHSVVIREEVTDTRILTPEELRKLV